MSTPEQDRGPLSSGSVGVADRHPRKQVLLRLSGIEKRWKRLPAPVLDGVDFELMRGETAWITGGNGAGKTTLMRIISGLIQGEAGEVNLGGLSPEKNRRQFQQGIGLLAAGDRGLYARLTVRAHLALWTAVAFVPRSKRAAATETALERFALEPIADARVDRLSMGQRQRLRLAMAFVHEPVLVLLDEPLNSLDEPGADILRTEIDRILERDGACMWFSPGNDHPGVDFTSRWHLAGGRLEAR